MADAIKVRYIGPHTDGVFVKGQFVAHGDTLEVSSEDADGLLEQVEDDSPFWEAVGKTTKSKSKPEPEQEN